MTGQELEERDFTVASEAEVDFDDAARAAQDSTQEFIWSNRDAVYRNPLYKGPVHEYPLWDE